MEGILDMRRSLVRRTAGAAAAGVLIVVVAGLEVAPAEAADGASFEATLSFGGEASADAAGSGPVSKRVGTVSLAAFSGDDS